MLMAIFFSVLSTLWAKSTGQTASARPFETAKLHNENLAHFLIYNVPSTDSKALCPLAGAVSG